jgi:aryl-alcohol dehydrogenase-like predicted oxidoreductase
MIYRDFGNTALKVSAIGFGAGEIGDYNIPDSNVEHLLNFALDSGITLIDTARGYYASEERIGKFISHRRNEFILSTKIGYGIEGYQDWSYDIIIAGVDEALKILKTDYIDIVHLHTCTKEVLKNNGVINALLKTKELGKIKVAAYSGENEDLAYAVNTGNFGSIQTSVNITDQRDIDTTIAGAKSKGMGVIAKRPIANAPWRFTEQPFGNYAEHYWLRWKKMSLNFDIEPNELFLRFTAFAGGIDTAITGTANIHHLSDNIRIVEKGPLPEDIYNSIKRKFKENDDNWIGLA